MCMSVCVFLSLCARAHVPAFVCAPARVRVCVYVGECVRAKMIVLSSVCVFVYMCFGRGVYDSRATVDVVLFPSSHKPTPVLREAVLPPPL